MRQRLNTILSWLLCIGLFLPGQTLMLSLPALFDANPLSSPTAPVEEEEATGQHSAIVSACPRRCHSSIVMAARPSSSHGASSCRPTRLSWPRFLDIPASPSVPLPLRC